VQPPSECSLFNDGQVYWLHRKGWVATKFTRHQPTWLSYVGCNASRLPQTSIKAQDYSGAEKCTAADLGKCWEGGRARLYPLRSFLSSFFSCPLLIPSRLADLCFLLKISASNYNEMKLSLISCCCLLLLRQSSSTGINVITHHSLRGSAAVC